MFVILVSKPYGERRDYATARKLWPEAEFVSASTPITLDDCVESIGSGQLVIDMLVGAPRMLLVYLDRASCPVRLYLTR